MSFNDDLFRIYIREMGEYHHAVCVTCENLMCEDFISFENWCKERGYAPYDLD